MNDDMGFPLAKLKIQFLECVDFDGKEVIRFEQERYHI